MDYLYIASCGLVVPTSPFWKIKLLAISNILPQISLLDEVNYLFFQLKIIFNIVPVISLELTVLVLISFAGIGFDFFRPLDEFFMLDLREHLDDRSIERWQNQLRVTRQEAFFCLTRQLIKLSTKSLLRSPNESTIPRGIFLKYDIADPFKVAENALHITSSDLNLDETLVLIILSMNGGSVCLIKASMVTGALVPVLMALGVQVFDLLGSGFTLVSRRMVGSMRCVLLLLTSSPSISGVRLDDQDSDNLGLLSRLEHGLGTGAARCGSELFVVRCCIRRALFSFMILICFAIPCISRWRPSRSGTWLVLAIGRRSVQEGLLNRWSLYGDNPPGDGLWSGNVDDLAQWRAGERLVHIMAK
ncbi:hypothetical protein Acr_21g0003940 [Actinidia rufa]|uniref:Uncharacterized protein n=1 Tax=Actinidia rufa TaxID=165716 RepID=A0A7J0GG93_9ERIC|nr:hypothetical protein Acr_21g0003940 [Actinidia rufa]